MFFIYRVQLIPTELKIQSKTESMEKMVKN